MCCGAQGSEAVQAILYWQRTTMEMMYRMCAPFLWLSLLHAPQFRVG
jgi:hypothetical protein